MTNKEIDCEHTDEIVCPYCGEEQSDSWEIAGENGDVQETECYECEKVFKFKTHIEVTFTSIKEGEKFQ